MVILRYNVFQNFYICTTFCLLFLANTPFWNEFVCCTILRLFDPGCFKQCRTRSMSRSVVFIRSLSEVVFIRSLICFKVYNIIWFNISQIVNHDVTKLNNSTFCDRQLKAYVLKCQLQFQSKMKVRGFQKNWIICRRNSSCGSGICIKRI